jgi:hypothetical protein
MDTPQHSAGNFAPVNVLADATTVTGQLDCKAVHLAVPFATPPGGADRSAFRSARADVAWPAFLAGAGIGPAWSGLSGRPR